MDRNGAFASSCSSCGSFKYPKKISSMRLLCTSLAHIYIIIYIYCKYIYIYCKYIYYIYIYIYCIYIIYIYIVYIIYIYIYMYIYIYIYILYIYIYCIIYIHIKAIGDVGILSLAKVHQLNILIILNINWSAVFFVTSKCGGQCGDDLK